MGPLSLTEDQPEVVIQGLARRNEGDWIVTLFLVNGQSEPKRLRDEAWLFQPELIVEAPDGRPIFRRRPQRRLIPVGRTRSPTEQQAMAMLYRDHVEFAVGHGVAVHAKTAPGDRQRAVGIATRVVPTFEVPRHSPPTVEERPALGGLVLDMTQLAEAAPCELPAMLAALPAAYREWIREESDKIEDPQARLTGFREEARRALAHCAHACERIEAGIQLLHDNEQAAEAFRFANRAMWLQRVHSLYAEARRRGQEVELADLDVPKNRTLVPVPARVPPPLPAQRDGSAPSGPQPFP